MNPDLIFVALSMVTSAAGNVPYIVGVLRKQIKPHVFSWVIWTLLTGIAAAAQFSVGAGLAFWATATAASFCAIIAALSIPYGTRDITRGDVAALVVALAAIPLWRMTNDPTWSVILVALIDVVGFIPTLRKAYKNPWQEGVGAFAWGALSWILSFGAIDHFSIATVLYPLVGTTVCLVCVALVLYRRKRVPG